MLSESATGSGEGLSCPNPTQTPTLHVLITGLHRPFSIPHFHSVVSEAAARTGCAPLAMDSFFISPDRTWSVSTCPSMEASAAVHSELQGKDLIPEGTIRLQTAFTLASAAECQAAMELAMPPPPPAPAPRLLHRPATNLRAREAAHVPNYLPQPHFFCEE